VLVALVGLTWLGESQGFTDNAGPSAAGAAYSDAVATGGFVETIALRWDFWVSEAVFLVIFQGVLTFIAFLAGILAARSQALVDRGNVISNPSEAYGLGVGFGIGASGSFRGNMVGQHALQLSLRPHLELAGFFGGFRRGPGSERRLCGDDVMANPGPPTILGLVGSNGADVINGVPLTIVAFEPHIWGVGSRPL